MPPLLSWAGEASPYVQGESLKGGAADFVRSIYSPVTSMMLVAVQTKGVEMSKPPADRGVTERPAQIADALHLVHAAAELVRSYERDKNYLPTSNDLAVLDRLIDAMWFYQGSLKSILRAFKRRANLDENLNAEVDLPPEIANLFRRD